jgi:hypothetical protein
LKHSQPPWIIRNFTVNLERNQCKPIPAVRGIAVPVVPRTSQPYLTDAQSEIAVRIEEQKQERESAALGFF